MQDHNLSGWLQLILGARVPHVDMFPFHKQAIGQEIMGHMMIPEAAHLSLYVQYTHDTLYFDIKITQESENAASAHEYYIE